MFTIFDGENQPATTAATEVYAWAIVNVIGGKGVMSQTGRYYNRPRATDLSQIAKLTRMLIRSAG